MNIVSRYYRAQSMKGFNCYSATLAAPIKVFERLCLQLAPKKKRGSMSYGFGLCDLPLLASYSRSGTNWVRYFIEYTSGHPTPGQTRLIQGDNYFIDRAHCAYPIMNSYKKIVLVLRDYKECLLRQNKESWLKHPDVYSFLTSEELKQPPYWYIKNLEAFDAFEGEKLLIYYEDLLNAPKETFSKLSIFLDLNQLRTHLFLRNLDQHFQASVEAYTKGGHSSETSSTKDLHFHSKMTLTPEHIGEFDQFYLVRYPKIANKYLLRYTTSKRLATDHGTAPKRSSELLYNS